jgi:hypothetical protein
VLFVFLVLAFTILNSRGQVSQKSIPVLPPANSRSSPDVSETIVALVQQSHDLNYQLSSDSRAQLLNRQIGMVARRNPEIARKWIDELFALSFEQKQATQVMAIQQEAINALAQFDPDRALDMLNRMSTPAPTKRSQNAGTPSYKSIAATRIFAAIAHRDGLDAIPVLEQEAERLSYEGTYSYSAIAAAANDAVLKESGRDHERAVSLIKPVFERAFARYSNRPENYEDNYAFGDMLIQMGGWLPKEVIRPALELLVKNLLATDVNAYQVQAQMLSCDGREVKADNAIDSALLRLASLMDRVDPEMSHQLGENRPALRLAVEEVRAGCERSLKFGPKLPPTARPQNPNLQLQADAAQFSNINSDAAVAKAEQISDEKLRTNTLLHIAGEIAGNDPERAKKLITDAQTNTKNGDPRTQLNLITAQVSLAAAQNTMDDLRELLQRGFDLALRGGGPVAVSAGPLVELGMQNDPDTTMAFVQNLPPSVAKAELLMAAASALEIPKLPFSSRPQQIANKPTQ